MTAERSSPQVASDNPIFQRHLFAYKVAASYVYGNVLEVGSGTGYGIRELAPKATHYSAIDKYETPVYNDLEHVHFQLGHIPPFPYSSEQFDVVVSFQVIEHIEDDHLFVSECARVLKPGGTLILSTPNIRMSLTRNPWHVREYTASELTQLCTAFFHSVEMKGIFGKETAMAYFEKNKAFVEKITRLDVFNLQYHLPRRILQIPYDVLNRLNRLALRKSDVGLTHTISTSDFELDTASDRCFDLFCIAQKSAG
ncbi:MAG: methyltransferase domain-containing protein [Rhodothermia bacterium]|nr:methyltransferase domain-containing protein [Rhodothermia bacterium]